MSDGGIIGASVIPTEKLASGVWRPNRIAQIRQSLQAFPVNVAVDANYSSVVGLYSFNQLTSDGRIRDLSSKGNHLFHNTNTGGSTLGFIGTTVKFGNFSFASGSITLGNFAGIASSDMSMGTSDFTVEGWIYLNSNSGTQEFFDFRPSDTTVNGPFMILNGGVLKYLQTGALFNITGATTITTAAWHHIHMTRISNVVYLGLDGTQQGSDFADSTNYTGAHFTLGSQIGTTAMINGFFGGVRITKGVAVYARTYTVPTAQFPNH